MGQSDMGQSDMGQSERFISFKLDNGLRVVIERMDDVRSVAAGFLCRTGARDESPEVAGVSHFLEHMCFKGTTKRNAAQINIDFDRIGGQPNAFTSHDRTFYHGVSRTADLEQLVEILADMMRSTLPEDEFAMEKNVVLEEIAMSNDRIEHVAFDLIVERVFEGHSLGWPVLGYDRTVKALTRDQMHAYFQRRYSPDNIVLVVTGAVEEDRVRKIAESYCSQWKRTPDSAIRERPVVRTGSHTRKIDRFKQQLVSLIFEAPSGADELHETAGAVASILGGGNSRFFWNIEQAGLSPHAGAYRLDFADCGLLILMAMCDPDNAERVLDAMRSEAKKLMTEPVTKAELDRVRNRRRTAVAVEGESPYHRATQVMDDVDYRDHPRSVEQRLAAVDAIGQESIAASFARYPVDGEGLTVCVGPG